MSIKIALAGNPNCGKTTLFNALTGSNQFVGNWPGVTVEKKEGKLKGHSDVTIMDLPGIYSLSPYTLEEVVARNYLVGERPDAILNIVDGTNIERNLYLSTQLMELGIPVIMAVNMMDILEKNGDKIHLDKLSEKLGCPVVAISALKGTGIKEAADKAVDLAKKAATVTIAHSFADSVEAVISAVEAKIGSDVADEQTTKEVLKDGMFHTGDYGRMNCHGRLVITKRNPGVLQLPTGEKICRRVINEEITAIHGVAESYLTMDGDKLTIVIVPIDKEMTADRMKKKIDKYNEKKGYRWEIQKVIVLKQNLPKLENGQVDGEAIQEMLETGQY